MEVPLSVTVGDYWRSNCIRTKIFHVHILRAPSAPPVHLFLLLIDVVEDVTSAVVTILWKRMDQKFQRLEANDKIINKNIEGVYAMNTQLISERVLRKIQERLLGGLHGRLLGQLLVCESNSSQRSIEHGEFGRRGIVGFGGDFLHDFFVAAKHLRTFSGLTFSRPTIHQFDLTMEA